MRNNPERLAWVVLLISFFTCVGLAVFVPLGTRWYVLNARIGQDVTLEIQRGPLRVTLAGRGAPVAIDEERNDIPQRTIVATDATAGRLVMHALQTDSPVVATIQLYDDTEVVLSSARSPRFPASHLPHEVVLEIRAGRVRINVSETEDRLTVAEVHTPHGAATFTEGSYEVKVNGTTMEVIVRDGQAGVVNNTEHVVPLGPEERAIIDGERIVGPLPAERNLLVDGDFRQSLEEGWQPYDKDVQQEPAGTVEVITLEGRPAAWFHREGIGHVEVGIRQEINYDVRDFMSLALRLSVQVRGQSLPGCGSLGSECPIIVRIDYEDIHGTDREWYHGFYSVERAATDWLNPWDEQVPFQTWYAYDSGNLVEALQEPPALIKAVTIYASGHSFDALVTEVELLARE
ncbi:MAG: FecR domain-containing protein [Anaerolineae bacterium]